VGLTAGVGLAAGEGCFFAGAVDCVFAGAVWLLPVDCATLLPSSTAPAVKVVANAIKGFLIPLLSHWRTNSANPVVGQFENLAY
jgi:hypothetical protein